MPAADFDDAGLVSAYRRVAAAALLLANSRRTITVELTRLFLSDSHVLAAAYSRADAEALGIAVIPETAAEAAGFAKSNSGAPGLYLLVDVGAMTLDVCAFRLVRDVGSDDRYLLLKAQVRPLGVEAYRWFAAADKTESKFIEQCNRCLWGVVWSTRTTRCPNAECWNRGNDLPIFLAGGGAQNDLHRRVVEELGPWLREHTLNGHVRLIPLPNPENTDLPVPLADFGRLAVAWGLSYPPNEIGEFHPPSTIDDFAPLEVVDVSKRYVSQELV